MNAIMLQHPIIQFSLYYLSRARLWEVEEKNSNFSSESCCGQLREVVT